MWLYNVENWLKYRNTYWIFYQFKPELFEVTLRGCYTCIIVFCLCEQCFVNIFLNVSRHYSYIKDNPPLNVNFYGVYIFEVIKIDILLGVSLFLHIDIFMVYMYLMYYELLFYCRLQNLFQQYFQFKLG